MKRRILEKDFQAWVVDVAERFGWRCLHVPFPVKAVGGGRFVPDQRAAGLPDLLLIHADPPRLVFAELKGTSGHPLSDVQREILGLLQAVGQVSVHAETDEGTFGLIQFTVRNPPERTVAAYLWEPGMEEQIETLLRSRVLS